MANHEEFTVRIEPDGRIVLEIGGVQETTYRRILEMLAETVGPVREVQIAPDDPPAKRLHHIKKAVPPNTQTLDPKRSDKG